MRPNYELVDIRRYPKLVIKDNDRLWEEGYRAILVEMYTGDIFVTEVPQSVRGDAQVMDRYFSDWIQSSTPIWSSKNLNT